MKKEKQPEIIKKEEIIIKEEKPKKVREPINWGKYVPKILLIGGFGLLASLMVMANTVRTPENNILIAMITLSVLLNILIVLGVFGTGIGIEIGKRFLRKFKYKSGQYVNTLLIMKSGVVREYFMKKDNETNSFKINDNRFVTNPTLLSIYKGIPTYFHKEGSADPMNVWENKLFGDLSNAEMDTVMNSVGMFDIKEYLEKNKIVLMFALLIMVGAAAAAGLFGYMSYEMLRDGTFNMGQVICSNIPQPPVIPGTQL